MFDTHKLNDRGVEKVAMFKTKMSSSIGKVMQLIPEGREKAIFKTKVEEAVFFGTKAIAAKPENHSEIVKYPEV